jgi:hypothetical protein
MFSRDAALKRLEELNIIITSLKNDIIRIEQDKQCVFDEHLALQVGLI